MQPSAPNDRADSNPNTVGLNDHSSNNSFSAAALVIPVKSTAAKLLRAL